MTNFKCISCKAESGYSTVCTNCMRDVKKSSSKKKRALGIIYEILRKEGLQCFHCGNEFPEESLIIDHFPYTKASRPDLYFDIRDMRLSCGPCNDSGSKNRTSGVQWLIDNNYPF